VRGGIEGLTFESKLGHVGTLVHEARLTSEKSGARIPTRTQLTPGAESWTLRLKK